VCPAISGGLIGRMVFMTGKKPKSMQGFTLVEVMIATVVFIIAVLGTSAYRYSAALSARRADLQTTAARTALLFCEGWRGESGVATYDPVTRFFGEMDISASAGPTKPDEFTPLGSYKVVLEGNSYFVTLSWQDNTGLRALNIIVAWDQHGSGSSNLSAADKTFKLTTYVEP